MIKAYSLKDIEQSKRFRATKLEGLIEDVTKDIQAMPQDHWAINFFRVRLKEYQTEYKELTGKYHEVRQ